MITFLCSDINAHGGAQNRELKFENQCKNKIRFLCNYPRWWQTDFKRIAEKKYDTEYKRNEGEILSIIGYIRKKNEFE